MEDLLLRLTVRSHRGPAPSGRRFLGGPCIFFSERTEKSVRADRNYLISEIERLR